MTHQPKTAALADEMARAQPRQMSEDEAVEIMAKAWEDNSHCSFHEDKQRAAYRALLSSGFTPAAGGNGVVERVAKIIYETAVCEHETGEKYSLISVMNAEEVAKAAIAAMQQPTATDTDLLWLETCLDEFPGEKSTAVRCALEKIRKMRKEIASLQQPIEGTKADVANLSRELDNAIQDISAICPLGTIPEIWNDIKAALSALPQPTFRVPEDYVPIKDHQKIVDERDHYLHLWQDRPSTPPRPEPDVRELVEALRAVSGRCTPEMQLVVDKALTTYDSAATTGKGGR